MSEYIDNSSVRPNDPPPERSLIQRIAAIETAIGAQVAQLPAEVTVEGRVLDYWRRLTLPEVPVEGEPQVTVYQTSDLIVTAGGIRHYRLLVREQQSKEPGLQSYRWSANMSPGSKAPHMPVSDGAFAMIMRLLSKPEE